MPVLGVVIKVTFSDMTFVTLTGHVMQKHQGKWVFALTAQHFFCAQIISKLMADNVTLIETEPIVADSSPGPIDLHVDNVNNWTTKKSQP